MKPFSNLKSAPPVRTHAEIMVIMGALMLGMLLAALDQTIVSTALPTIASDLNSLDKLSWVATSYLLTSAIATPIFGKLGDLFGRKKLFQLSIIIFLLGSALSGLSHTIDQLVFFRALQGIGGGGLMSLVFAIIGDVIPPRQRGRYQGYFGAVFAVASVAGPLLGGFFSGAHTILGLAGWRWIFYINIPLGLVALAVVAAKLDLPIERSEHKIDYLGTLLLSLGVVSILLVSVWANVQYAWSSPQIILLILATAIFTAAFVWWELRASEPLIPMSLFKSDIFNVAIILSFLSGMAMFASILYIPEYQQVVRGYSPTKSGLMMLPLVLGMMTSSIVSGRLISAYGRYKIFPVIGNLLMAFGLWLFSHVTLTTDIVTLGIWMLILGLGLGLFMQVATLAIQNSVDRSVLGTATSSVVFFRSLGSALGGAIFGTILTSRLSYHLHELLPPGTQIPAAALQHGGSALIHAPAAIRAAVASAFVASFHDMFLTVVPVALVAVVMALLLREAPLRNTAESRTEGAISEA